MHELFEEIMEEQKDGIRQLKDREYIDIVADECFFLQHADELADTTNRAGGLGIQVIRDIGSVVVLRTCRVELPQLQPC